MPERFSRFFKLEDNLHNPGAPVIVAAGVLLKDNQTGKVLAQLKFRNVGVKLVKGVKVKLFPKDEEGRDLPVATEHEYKDVVADRDREFGQKEPVILSDATARSFSLTVTEVLYSDDTVWTGDGSPCVPLEGTKPLEERLDQRQELLEACYARFGRDAKNLYTVEGGLWSCPCGALNQTGEESCHHCGRKAADLAGFTPEELEKEGAAVKARMAEEKRRADEEQARREAEEKALKAQKLERNRRLLFIAIPVVVLLLVIAFVMRVQSVKKENYQNAMNLLDEGSYEAAESAFRSLEGYKDSEEMAENIWFEAAQRLFERGEYQESFDILAELADGEDAEKAQKALKMAEELAVELQELRYAEGQEHEESRQWADAQDDYYACGDYLDAREKAIEMGIKRLAVDSTLRQNKYRSLTVLNRSAQYFRVMDEEEAREVLPGLWLEAGVGNDGWSAYVYDANGTAYVPRTPDQGEHWTIWRDGLLVEMFGQDCDPLKPWTPEFWAAKLDGYSTEYARFFCEAAEGVYADVTAAVAENGEYYDYEVYGLRIAPDSPYAIFVEKYAEVTGYPQGFHGIQKLQEAMEAAPAPEAAEPNAMAPGGEE